MNEGLCRLCGKTTVLAQSHVLPKWVFRWMNRNNVTGRMRSVESPNRAVQDGVRMRLLCLECEQRFSVFEAYMYKCVFVPLMGDGEVRGDTTAKVAYDGRLSKFAASVAWRGLVVSINTLPAPLHARAHAALATWKRDLLDDKEVVSEHHLYVFPYVTDAPPISDSGLDINFYLLSTVYTQPRYRTKEGDIFILTKLPGMCIVSSVWPAAFQHLKGTRIVSGHGFVSAADHDVALPFWDLMCHDARTYVSRMDMLSDRQKEDIARRYRENSERVQGSRLLHRYLGQQRGIE